jgi:putative ABC transport system permease protein
VVTHDPAVARARERVLVLKDGSVVYRGPAAASRRPSRSGRPRRTARELVDLVGFALRALRGHRLRTRLSLLGVAIGVAAVVTLTALGEGARRYVRGQFAAVGSNMVIVLPGKSQTTGALPASAACARPHVDDALAVARGVREVDKLAPMVVGTETVGLRRAAPAGGAVRLVARGAGGAPARDGARGASCRRSPWDRGAPVAVLGSRLAQELFPPPTPSARCARRRLAQARDRRARAARAAARDRHGRRR